MESADTTSPLRSFASSTARAVLPEAVGPVMTKILGGIGTASLQIVSKYVSIAMPLLSLFRINGEEVRPDGLVYQLDRVHVRKCDRFLHLQMK